MWLVAHVRHVVWTDLIWVGAPVRHVVCQIWLRAAAGAAAMLLGTVLLGTMLLGARTAGCAAARAYPRLSGPATDSSPVRGLHPRSTVVPREAAGRGR